MLAMWHLPQAKNMGNMLEKEKTKLHTAPNSVKHLGKNNTQRNRKSWYSLWAVNTHAQNVHLWIQAVTSK